MMYRVLSPFLAITSEPERFKTLPEGSFFTTDENPNRTGLVDILYQGEVLAVFMTDIRNRCVLAAVQSEAKASRTAV